MKVKAINIDGVTQDEQIRKFMEEVTEFLIEAANENKENAKEEYCDILTAGAGVLKKLGISDEEIENYYNNEHMKKLKSRGWKPRNK